MLFPSSKTPKLNIIQPTVLAASTESAWVPHSVRVHHTQFINIVLHAAHLSLNLPDLTRQPSWHMVAMLLLSLLLCAMQV